MDGKSFILIPHKFFWVNKSKSNYKVLCISEYVYLKKYTYLPENDQHHLPKCSLAD